MTYINEKAFSSIENIIIKVEYIDYTNQTGYCNKLFSFKDLKSEDYMKESKVFSNIEGEIISLSLFADITYADNSQDLNSNLGGLWDKQLGRFGYLGEIFSAIKYLESNFPKKPKNRMSISVFLAKAEIYFNNEVESSEVKVLIDNENSILNENSSSLNRSQSAFEILVNKMTLAYEDSTQMKWSGSSLEKQLIATFFDRYFESEAFRLELLCNYSLIEEESSFAISNSSGGCFKYSRVVIPIHKLSKFKKDFPTFVF